MVRCESILAMPGTAPRRAVTKTSYGASDLSFPHGRGPAIAGHEAGAGGRRRAYREMTIAGVLWGTIGPAAAIGDEHTSLSPLQTSFWRLVIAAVPLAVLAVVATRGTSQRRRPLLLFGLAVGAVKIGRASCRERG